MEHDEHRNSDAMGSSGPKRRYQTPVLLTFGKVAALTRQSACTAMNDSSIACDPTAMNMAKVSDRRFKENIVRIGSHPFDIGLYLFDYKPEFRDAWGHGKQFGVMADEVEAVMPEAVCVHSDGYRRVDYSMLGIIQFTQ